MKAKCFVFKLNEDEFANAVIAKANLVIFAMLIDIPSGFIYNGFMID